MNAPLTRREALSAGMCATAGFLGVSAALEPKADDNKSWVGKTVLPKKPDPVGTYSIPAPKPKEPPPPPVELDKGVLPVPPIVFLKMMSSWLLELDKGDVQPVPTAPKAPATELTHVLQGASWEVKAEKIDAVEVFDIVGPACWVKKDLLVQLDDADGFYTKAIKDDPNDIYAYNFRGWAKYLLGKREDALKDFDEFLKLSSAVGELAVQARRPVGFSNRGLILAEMGKFDAAFKDLNEAVSQSYAPAMLNRGWASELKGDYLKATTDYLLAIDSLTLFAANNIAWLWATCPDEKFRNGKEVVKFAKAICEQTANREGMFLDTLAAAHAEVGDFDAAVKAQELAMKDKGYTRKYGDDAKKRLHLYKDKKPFRSTPFTPV